MQLILVFVIIVILLIICRRVVSGSFEFNPKIITTKINGITIVRDDKLIGGTKQRAIKKLMIKLFTDRPRGVVYAGPSSGAAQICIGLISQEYNVPAHMFTDIYDSPLKQTAKTLGVQYHMYKEKLYKIREIAETFARENDFILIPFGFDSDDFRKYLTKALKRAVPQNIIKQTKRVWVVAGSANLMNVLYKIFPKAHFNAVQVGRTVKPEQIDTSRTTLYVAPEKFYQPAEFPPPYDSVITYDAKLWRFVMKYGKKGDLVWNVK